MLKKLVAKIVLLTGLLIAVPVQAQSTPPATPSCPAWSSDVVYLVGQCALYDGKTFKAKWWTRGDLPSTEAPGAWELAAAPDPSGCMPWTASATFTAGRCASYGGKDFVAKWWTQGTVPSAEQAGPWELKTTPDANDCVPWTAGAAYTAGQCAIYQGKDYRANWWTQGDVPGLQASGPWTSIAVATLSVGLDAPKNDTRFTAPATIALQATGTANIVKVEFYQGSTLLGTALQAPFTFNWLNIAAGSYAISVKGYDSAGGAAVSEVVNIVVTGVASQVYFIQPDHLDTPRVITDQASRVVWRWDSDAFGSALPDERPSGAVRPFVFNLRFPGQYFDGETGLHYNYYRDYDPQTGRYVQSDPFGLEAGINTYAYVGGNPLSRSDPLGLWATDAHNYFIDIVFRGLNPAIRELIKNGSAHADSMQFQGPTHAYMHAMSSSAMSPAEAQKAMCKYIKDMMSDAQDAMNKNDAHYWFYLGMALHAVMDNTSPAHVGFQKWNGVMADGSKHGPWPSSLENLSVAQQPQHTQATVDAMNKALSGDLRGCGCK